jgi:hypothetical protein
MPFHRVGALGRANGSMPARQANFKAKSPLAIPLVIPNKRLTSLDFHPVKIGGLARFVVKAGLRASVVRREGRWVRAH